MINKRIKAIVYLLFFNQIISGQTSVYDLTPIDLSSTSQFNNPSKQWEIVGSVKSDMNSTEFKSNIGKGTLLNRMLKSDLYKPGLDLFTKMEHGDIYLELDFAMPKNSNSGIYLQGRYEVQLYESWGQSKPTHTDVGGIYERWIDASSKGFEGHPPRTNAGLAPGLWQHLAIEFQAPKFDNTGKKIQNAIFKKVILNGIVLHENVIVYGPTRAAAFQDEKAMGPLMIQGDHGQVAFRNIKYALLGEYSPKINKIDYEYYEINHNSFDKLTPDQLKRKGTVNVIDYTLADNVNKMALIFNANFDIDEAGEYQWIIIKNGHAKFSVDDKEILSHKWSLRDDNTAYKTYLNKGSHTFKLSHLKDFNWRPTVLGLYLIKANKKPFAFHSINSLPDPDPVPQIEVDIPLKTKSIRHYADHLGKKKTHVISVGNPDGVHYMYDLNQGGIMKAWKYDFLNTTEMWYERGEPQTAINSGAGITFPGRFPIGLDITNLADTMNPEKELIFKGYRLNETKKPTFSYKYHGMDILDYIEPTESGKAIKRTITVSNPTSQKLVYRLAEGNIIEDLGNGLFAINDQSYYLKVTADMKPTIIVTKGGKELVIEKSEVSSSVSYSIYF
jgi:hypothetical protein